jgi:hypothetical protein
LHTQLQELNELSKTVENVVSKNIKILIGDWYDWKHI